MWRQLGKVWLYTIIILAVSGWPLILAGTAPAQEQASKATDTPSASEKSPPKPAMAPSPEKEALESPKAKKGMAPMPREETLHKKKVTDTVGGQEIRATEKEGEENR